MNMDLFYVGVDALDGMSASEATENFGPLVDEGLADVIHLEATDLGIAVSMVDCMEIARGALRHYQKRFDKVPMSEKMSTEYEVKQASSHDRSDVVSDPADRKPKAPDGMETDEFGDVDFHEMEIPTEKDAASVRRADFSHASSMWIDPSGKFISIDTHVSDAEQRFPDLEGEAAVEKAMDQGLVRVNSSADSLGIMVSRNTKLTEDQLSHIMRMLLRAREWFVDVSQGSSFEKGKNQVREAMAYLRSLEGSSMTTQASKASRFVVAFPNMARRSYSRRPGYAFTWWDDVVLCVKQAAGKMESKQDHLMVEVIFATKGGALRFAGVLANDYHVPASKISVVEEKPSESAPLEDDSLVEVQTKEGTIRGRLVRKGRSYHVVRHGTDEPVSYPAFMVRAAMEVQISTSDDDGDDITQGLASDSDSSSNGGGSSSSVSSDTSNVVTSAMTRSLSELEEELRAAGVELPAGGYGKKELVELLKKYHWSQEHPGEEMPNFVEPMLLRNVTDLKPGELDKIWKNPDFYIEQKRDGVRCIVSFDSTGKPRAYSRNISVKNYLPGDLTPVIFWMPSDPRLAGVTLDGELISSESKIDTAPYTASGKGGVTQNVLQAVVALTSMRDTQKCQEAHGLPLRYVAYDIISVGQESLLKLPYLKRREKLADIFKTLSSLSDKLVLNPSTNESKQEFYNSILEQGGEGGVFKHKDLKYQPGVRAKDTYKIKTKEELDCLVTGFVPPSSGSFLQEGLVGGLEFSCKDTTSGEWVPVGASAALDLETRRSITKKNPDGTFGGLIDGIIGKWIFEVEFRGWSKNYRMVHARPLRRRDGASADSKSPDDCTFDYEAVKKKVDSGVQLASRHASWNSRHNRGKPGSRPSTDDDVDLTCICGNELEEGQSKCEVCRKSSVREDRWDVDKAKSAFILQVALHGLWDCPKCDAQNVEPDQECFDCGRPRSGVKQDTSKKFYKKKISDEDVAKYNIPVWALQWAPGGSVPEGAFYTDGREPVGSKVDNPYGGNPRAIVIYETSSGSVATGFHGLL